MAYHIIDYGSDYQGPERYVVAEVYQYAGRTVIVRKIPWWEVTWSLLRDVVETDSDEDIINAEDLEDW